MLFWGRLRGDGGLLLRDEIENDMDSALGGIGTGEFDLIEIPGEGV